MMKMVVVVAAVVYPKGPGTESRVSVSSSVYKAKPAAFDQRKK
jgi:hypothetical protein